MIATTSNCIGDIYGLSQPPVWTVTDVLRKFTVEQLLELKTRLPEELQSRIPRLEREAENALHALRQIRGT